MASKTDPRFFVEITRVDDEERMVYGYATTEAVDSYGTVIDLGRVKEILPDYMKWANIREMHQPSAAGTAQEATIDDTGLYLAAKIVDNEAWTKVKEKVYKGFSIGGKKDYESDKRVFLKEITEISLVDRPSNPECVIDEYRVYGGDTMADEKREEEGAATAALVEQRAEMPDLKRYLGEEIWDAKVALNALEGLIYLLDKEQSEAHPEAASQAADLRAVIEKLKSFIASEIMEGKEEPITMAAGTDADVQRSEPSPDTGIPASASDDVTRAGARNNKADLKRLQEMHDHCVALGAACAQGTEEKADNPDLTRIEGLEADITRLDGEVKRLEGENSNLKAEVERLKQEPESPKGALKSVDKGDDVTDTKRQAEEAELKRIETLPPEQQAVELVKRAQRTPHFMRLG